MKFTSTLIRRTVVSLSAIAALIVTGYAASQTSQSVQLQSNGVTTAQCTYSSMTVTPSGGVVVTCGASTAGPGTFTITGPTSLATGTSTTGTTVKVTRTGGSSGAVDVNISAAGACTSSTPMVSFADLDAVAKGVLVTAAATSGDCVLSVSPVTGNAGPNLTIKVVDPDDPVVFAFAQPASGAQIGTGNDVIVVTRTGGTNGQWTVPVTITGDLTSAGTLPTTSGTLNPSSLNLVFPNGGASQTITYSPPGIMPAGTTLTMTLGTPVGPVPASTQTASLGTVAAHTITLAGAAVGCPASTDTALSLSGQGTVNHMGGPSPYVKVYALPIASTGIGQLGLYSAPNSPKALPAHTEISISKCKGDFTDNADGCYQAVDALDGTQINQEWANKYTSRYPNTAAFVKQKRCLISGTGAGWYINIRVTHGGACSAGVGSPAGYCGWDPIWKYLTL